MTTPNRATLSIIGLYNWDDHIFDALQLPVGVDADEVEQNILMECGELTLLYPDWDFMYQALEWWSRKELPSWEKIYALTQLEYNPIENYDRYENEMEGESLSGTHEKASQSARSSQGTNTLTGSETQQTTGSTVSLNQNNTVNQVAGFNTNDLAAQSGSTGNTSASDETTGNGAYQSAQSAENSGEETTNLSGLDQDEERRNRNRSARIHGNIGVSTPADMMEKELSIYPKINIVEHITQAFKTRFCVMVY